MEKEICIICHEDLNDDKKTKFFCQCKLNIHNKCYDRFYIQNLYKCCICMNHDYESMFVNIYIQYLNRIEIFKTLTKMNCPCKLKNMNICHNFKIILYDYNKNLLFYIPFDNKFPNDILIELKNFIKKMNKKKYLKLIIKQILLWIDYIKIQF